MKDRLYIDKKLKEIGVLLDNKCIELKEQLDDFVKEMIDCQVGELVVNSVDNDGLMNGFDADLINHVTKISNLPIIAVGGGGNLEHYSDLFSKSNIKAVGSSSIFHFTQFTPLDIKNELKKINIPVRL